jgi:hypothetical protein
MTVVMCPILTGWARQVTCLEGTMRLRLSATLVVLSSFSALAPARAVPVVEIQPVSICLNDGSSCGSMSYDAAALQSFWLNQAGLTLDILPSRTFNSTTFQTMDNQTELTNFLTTNADPNGPVNFTSSPINVWFSQGFAGGPLGDATISGNRIWLDSDDSTNILTLDFAHQLGHALGLQNDTILTGTNLMDFQFQAGAQLSSFSLDSSQVSALLASQFIRNEAVVTPLPATFPLFAAGLGGLGLLGLRRKRSPQATI